jgi:hypothetical protein
LSCIAPFWSLFPSHLRQWMPQKYWINNWADV